jgi:hypothetical protein
VGSGAGKILKGAGQGIGQVFGGGKFCPGIVTMIGAHYQLTETRHYI